MRTRRTKSSSNPVPSNEHRSVLLHESIGVLDIRPDSKVVDATLGGAGHAIEIIKKLNENGIFIGIDADRDAIDRARNALKTAKPKTHVYLILVGAYFI
jgi:16S rRNA (cytosine1402-N4)-methyltransferase